jgi:hypothetical protein
MEGDMMIKHTIVALCKSPITLIPQLLLLLCLTHCGRPVVDVWTGPSGNAYMVRYIARVQHEQYGEVLHIQYKSPQSDMSKITNAELREVFTIINDKFDLEEYDVAILDALFENLLFINCGRIDIHRQTRTIEDIKRFLKGQGDFLHSHNQS